MTDPAPTTESKPAETVTPPAWVTDGSFDPARAWALIENLRAEVGSIKSDRDAVKADADRAKAAERALWTERALRKHPLPEGLSDEEMADLSAFLTGETAEEIERKAARLAALRGEKAAEQPRPDRTSALTIPGRPEPTLAPTPGHGAAPVAHFDGAAVAKAIRSRR